MEILEFGDTNKRKIILIHGFQCPYQIWNPYIEYYKKDFHIIVPIMSGYNPKQKEDFITFSKEAKDLEDYYISRYNEKVYSIYGMSMGGVLAATLWQNRRLSIENVFFDGTPLVFFHGVVRKMMLCFYLNITHKAQKRDKKTLKQAVNSIVPKENLTDLLYVLDNMSDTTISNCINSIADFKLSSDIDTPNTKIHFYYGTAVNEMLAKKSVKFILKNYPHTVIKCFKGKSHCEISIFQPELMIEEFE